MTQMADFYERSSNARESTAADAKVVSRAVVVEAGQRRPAVEATRPPSRRAEWSGQVRADRGAMFKTAPARRR